ncbi:MAG: copper chaperone PCu(A)C [Methylophaga sp.]|nr:copper chaperone PCu(A)C [Methylophaga sp.]
MNNGFKNSIVILLILFSWISNLSAESGPDIQFENFWIVQPPNVARSTAGYGIIKNTGDEADTLIRVCSEAAEVMLHQTKIESGMAKMVHMTNTVIEPNSELVLEPMSFHLMFMGLSDVMFEEGAEITLLFEFEKSGEIEVKLPIRSSWQ